MMDRAYRIGCVGLIILTTFSIIHSQDAPNDSQTGQKAPPDQWRAEIKKTGVIEAYGKLPLSFEANQGQADERVRFLCRGGGYRMFLTSDEAVLLLRKPNPSSGDTEDKAVHPRAEVLRIKWEGTNQDSKIEGLEKLEGKSHYFLGNDRDRWKTHIASYRKVRYQNFYPGIDLIYYGNQRQLEYDLVVTPKGDPDAIRISIEGMEEVKVDEKGNLIFRIGGEEVIHHAPRIYQEGEGKKRFIKGGYVVIPSEAEEKNKIRVGFKVGEFDKQKPLIIDPVLIYSSYLGGSNDDFGYSLALDGLGNAYISGTTFSTNFPTEIPIQRELASSDYDAFITKLDPMGSSLVYSTFLGGSGDDSGWSIAVDGSGSAYITGATSSPQLSHGKCTSGRMGRR
jgi:hypothetical protein